MAALLVVIAALGGCGQSSAQRTPDLRKLPLVTGSRVVVQVRRCDSGANAFCAWELVVANNRYRTPGALLKAEHRYLKSLGWTGAGGDTNAQWASDSPGHQLRLTYATPQGELQGTELGSVKRASQVQKALSLAMFEHTTAMSVLYEIGAS